MRVVWMLAIACLVAASVVRPLRIDRSDSHAAHLEAAPLTVATGARREVPRLPDLRLAPFVAAPRSVAEPPVMIALASSWQLASPTSACAVAAPRARGPPSA
jgi:hypothetical protein